MSPDHQRKRLNRILLKLSGEALAGDDKSGLNSEMLGFIAGQIAAVALSEIQTAVVVGGGNFIRGERLSKGSGINQAVADQMGMLATLINSLALQEAIEQKGVQTRVMSAVSVQAVCEPYVRRRAVRHLEKGRVVIVAAGTGNPFFTTDTAAVLRALEINADALIKATKVDGVYDKDPKTNGDAKKYERVGFREAISQKLGVMDQTAFTMCEEHSLPIVVLSIFEKDSILKAAMGEEIGTWVGV